MKIDLSFLTPLTVHVLQTPPSAPDSGHRGTRAIFTFQIDNLKCKGENMAVSLPAGYFAPVSVQWVDAYGNPAPVQGDTAWASSDPTIAEVTVGTGNSLVATIHSLGPIGNVSVQATADADMGEGVKAITAALDVTVIGGQASGGTIDVAHWAPTPPPGTK
jgi:hypothetical protein